MLERFVPRTEFNSYQDFYDNFSIIIPDDFNFAYDVIDRLAAEKPDKTALVWCDTAGAEASFTYAQVKEFSDKAAVVFTRAGITKGDPVMLVLKRRFEYWWALLALHKIGAIGIPATHLLTTKDYLYRCKLATIAGILCVDEPEVIHNIDEACGQLGKNAPRFKAFARSVHRPLDEPCADESWFDFNAALAAAPTDWKRPPSLNTNDDTMLLYFTSGTTGMPKMVRHNFVYPLGHIVTARYWQQVQEGGLHLTVADTGWAKTAWGKIYGQWICGSAVFVYDYDKFVPAAMLEVITRHKITSFCAPPTIYRFFIKEDLRAYDFSSIKHCVVAGEPLNPEIYDQFLAGTGLQLRECYGQTELTVTMATFPWLTPKPGSMGKPAPGYDIVLVRDDGSFCRMGEEGQIAVRTSTKCPLGIFGGYYRDPALTAQVWHDDLYYTGDVAWFDEDGYYWFVGRADDVIKSSGYRIGPFEVESALMEHPSVVECAITGVPDPDRGTVVKASIVLAKGYEASESLARELQNHVKKTTAPYKYPRIVEFVKELPKTISGKIRRVQIRDDEK
ncbi:MAG: AMP-binding protein [Spirochaetaceae bacterium]|jgi:acetyl-CoA synthetase|nr:AMP-binding protein [Spirochaetaceae bacterium]